MFGRVVQAAARPVARSAGRFAQSSSTCAASPARLLRNAPSSCFRVQMQMRWQAQAEQQQGEAAQKQEQQEQTSQQQTQSGNDAEELKKQLAEKTKVAEEMKDKYYRALAEVQNLDSRRNREVTEARQHALFKFASDLVGNLDMLNLAQRNVPAAIADPKHPDHSYYTGVGMVYSNLLKTLRQHNVAPIEVSDDGTSEFNAHLHDCVAHVPHPTVPKNHIIETHRTGWKLNDRVVRAAAVVVSAGAPPKPAE